MYEIIDNKIVKTEIQEVKTIVSSSEISEEIKSIDETIENLTKAKKILEKDLKEIVELEQKIYESEIKKP